jgi:nucleoside-diphosphate-sugar epimerase
MKKAILIGASGFLGQHLLDVLLENKIEVFVIEHKNKTQKSLGSDIVKGGISSINSKLIDQIKPDVIFHCARPSIPHFKWAGRKMAARIAFHLNKKLLSELHKSKQKPILTFASGSLMYGNSDQPHDENAPLNPLSFAKQYFKGEDPILKATHTGYPVQMLRFPWLLGNGSWFTWFYLELAKKFGAIPGFDKMNNKMHIMDVRDAAKLMYLYAQNAIAPGIYNICSDTIVEQKEFVEQVSSIFGVPIKNYKIIFPKGLETEAIEAFNSNIILKTNFPEIINQYSFIPLTKSLKDIKLHSVEMP